MTEPSRCHAGRCAKMRPGLCDSCARHHARRLSELATLAGRLQAMLGRGQAAGDRVSGSREPPLPVREAILSFLGPAAASLAGLEPPTSRSIDWGLDDWRGSPQHGPDPLLDLLASWCRCVAEERSMTAPGPSRQLVAAARYAGRAEPRASVGELVSWLQRHHEWATEQPWADDYAEEVFQAWCTARSLADAWERPEPIDGVPCPDCDLQALYRQPGGDRFCNRTVGGCGLTMSDDHYEWWTGLLAHDAREAG